MSTPTPPPTTGTTETGGHSQHAQRMRTPRTSPTTETGGDRRRPAEHATETGGHCQHAQHGARSTPGRQDADANDGARHHGARRRITARTARTPTTDTTDAADTTEHPMEPTTPTTPTP